MRQFSKDQKVPYRCRIRTADIQGLLDRLLQLLPTMLDVYKRQLRTHIVRDHRPVAYGRIAETERVTLKRRSAHSRVISSGRVRIERLLPYPRIILPVIQRPTEGYVHIAKKIIITKRQAEAGRVPGNNPNHIVSADLQCAIGNSNIFSHRCPRDDLGTAGSYIHLAGIC